MPLAFLGALVLAITVSLGAATAIADAPPVVTIDPSPTPGYNTAEVSGTVNPSGGPSGTFWQFQVSTNPSDESSWTYAYGEEIYGPAAEGTSPIPVSPTLEYLTPSTEYSVRLVAENGEGANRVVTEAPYPTFTTKAVAKPGASIDPVTTFTGTTAKFTGTIEPGTPPGNPSAFDVSWEIHCTPECPGLNGFIPADSTTPEVEINPEATGLEPNTTYQAELIVSNAGGTETVQTSFKTAAVGPGAETVPAFAIGGGNEAVVGGKVNPKNSETKYWFEYGPGPGGPGATYPNSIPVDHEADAGSGSQPVFVTKTIEGLTPASTYHFRLVAKNSTGTTPGEDVSFQTLGLPTPPPASCPNDKLRSETGSEQLGECRAYEMTTRPNKGGGDADSATTSSPNGNRLGYSSLVAPPGAKSNNAVSTSLAERTASGWVSQSLTPADQAPNYGSAAGFRFADFNDDLSKAIIISRAAVSSEPNVMNVLLVSPDGTVDWATKPTVEGLNPAYFPDGEIDDKYYTGRSADGSHIVFESHEPYADGASNYQIWEWINGEVRLVSILPDGVTSPEGRSVGSGVNASVTKGIGFGGTLPDPTAVSEDGSRIFFGLGASGVAKRVFVRENGTITRELSLSERAGSVGDPAPEARFAGAAADGSVALFSTPELLTEDATPGGGLYAYDLEAEELRFLSAGASNPNGAQFQGVSLVSRDGSQVYFVADSILVPGKGSEGAGRHNLYIADQSGVHFIATLGNDDGQDWINSFGNTERRSVAASPDGTHFIFQSYERLTAFDNAGHNEIYRFDRGDERLTCISCGLRDQAPVGDASIFYNPLSRGGFSASSQAGRPRVILADGRVLFQSTESLLPGDVNGRADVYLYDEGRLSLISTGVSKYPSEIADISPDGGDIFFLTRESLVGQDIDGGAKDIYDARINGGFPAPAVANPCETEVSCQGTPSPEPGFTSPPTTAPGRGNPPGHGKKRCKAKAKTKQKKCGKKHHLTKKKKHASKSGRGK